MIPAKLRVRDDEREYGYWQFVALPNVGDAVAITINDQPATFKVSAVVHVPIASTTPIGSAVPRVEVFVTRL